MKLLDPDCHHELTVIESVGEYDLHLTTFTLWCPKCKKERKLIYDKNEKGKKRLQWLPLP